MKSAIFKCLVMMFALTMTACSSMKFHPSFTGGTAVQAIPEIVYPTIEVAVPEVELVAEVPAVQQRTIPNVPDALADRAIVHITEAEIKCVSDAIYYEARGEPLQGKAAVAYVVLNRMGHSYFPKTACAVVHQSSRGMYQFSWAKKPSPIRDRAAYAAARQVAIDVMSRQLPNPVGDAIFFRHKAVGGRHGAKQTFRVAIGNHRFFAAI